MRRHMSSTFLLLVTVSDSKIEVICKFEKLNEKTLP